MRIAIFSDVHGNLTALRAVLEDIDSRQDVEAILFAGDLCLFGPRPAACVELIRSRDEEIACIYGNTDRWVDGPPLLAQDVAEEERLRQQRIHDVASWTRERLSHKERAWLRELPFHRRVSPLPNPQYDLFVVHANPQDDRQIIFPSENDQDALYGEVRQTDADLDLLLGELVTGVLAFGHLHVPFTRRWRDVDLVNVGSVSLPGDDDPRAKYALFSWGETNWQVAHHYVSYDVDEEIEAFREAQPPGWEESVAKLQDEGMIAQRV